jgi:hypothetical protein
MTFVDTQRKLVRIIIADCEAAIGYKLDRGYKMDLLADNFTWDRETLLALLNSVEIENEKSTTPNGE